MTDWKIFHGNRAPHDQLRELPKPPPWRFSQETARLKRPANLDLDAEKALIAFFAAANHQISSAHDLSGGGLAIALAESGIAGGRGFRLEDLEGEPHRSLFSESPSRAIVTCPADEVENVLALAERAGTTATRIGTVGGPEMGFGPFSMPLARAREVFEGALPKALSSSIV